MKHQDGIPLNVAVGTRVEHPFAEQYRPSTNPVIRGSIHRYPNCGRNCGHPGAALDLAAEELAAGSHAEARASWALGEFSCRSTPLHAAAHVLLRADGRRMAVSAVRRNTGPATAPPSRPNYL